MGHFFFIILEIVIFLYLILILNYIRGWFANFNSTFVEKKASTFVEKELNEEIVATVIISCRNEDQNISNLLDGLIAQKFDKKYEVIIVNDHSEDKTEQIVLAYAEKYRFIKLYSLIESQGKKNAIQLGIEKSESELIVVSDADCIVGENWLSTFYSLYKKYDVYLISAIVVLKGNNFFSKLQELEFLSLIASGAGSIGFKKGIMCNGANLAFSKKIFNRKNVLNSSQTSGDDVFLLQSVKKYFNNKVIFSPLQELIVETKTKPNLRTFLNQRVRWASKSSSYSDWDMKYASILVFLSNVSLLLLFFFSFLYRNAIPYFLSGFILKTTVDFALLYLITAHLKTKKLLKYFIALVVFYPIYIVFVALFSQLIGFTWKGRTY